MATATSRTYRAMRFGSSVSVRTTCGQIRAVDELHGEEVLAVDSTDLVDLYNIGVVQVFPQRALRQETARRPCRTPGQSRIILMATSRSSPF